MSSEHHDEAVDGPDDTELEALIAQLDDADLDPAGPPASVWETVAARISTDTADEEPRIGSVGEPGRPAHSTAARRATRQRWGLLGAAAAVVLLVGGITTWFATRDESRVVATAQLAHETGFDAAGASATASAELIERDGDYLISLQDSQLPNELGEPADLELWLIEADADGNLDVQPVAIINRGDGTYSVPAGLDPETHNIVDISIEPRDGDTTHSGRSILRGTLIEA